MKRSQILCVKKILNDAQKWEISDIGGVNDVWNEWHISTKEAIVGINSGLWEFYIIEDFKEILVRIFAINEFEFTLSAKEQGYLHNLLEDLPDFK